MANIKWGDTVTGLEGIIAAAQALKDGAPVQAQYKDEWHDTRPEFAFFPDSVYRIGEVVKPREFWVDLYFDGEVYIYDSKELADQGADTGCIECIHMREVIE